MAEKALLQLRKDQARELAAAEVALFESHIEALTSMHRECAEPFDWEALLVHPLPPTPAEPSIERDLSNEARAALEAHNRSLVGRLLGSKRRLELEQALADAEEFERATEQKLRAEYQAQLTEHTNAIKGVLETQELAACILDGDLEAQLEAVELSGCLNEIAGNLGQNQVHVSLNVHRATVVLHVEQDTIVPAKYKSLTAKGTVSERRLAAARRMEIYEDYVCGAALRAAREIMAVIPTAAVLVNVESTRVVPATGHLASCVILSVLVPRELMSEINWERVDASELVATLHHNMKLRRGSGFQVVERLTFTGSE